MASPEGQARGDARDIYVDPVSHEAVDPAPDAGRSFYAGHMYHFASRANKDTFDDDPELWVSTAHVSQTSAHVSPIGEPE